MATEYYVYAILVDGLVRYIGKGKKNRAQHHLKVVKSLARRRASGEVIQATYFYNKLTNAWLAGSEIMEEILFSDLTDAQAFALEKKEIKRRKGLWNFTEGGDGLTAKALKKIRRRKSYQKKMSTWYASEKCRQTGKQGIAATQTPEAQAKRRATMNSPEWKKKHGKKLLERGHALAAQINSDPEMTRRRKAAIQAFWELKRGERLDA